jgi:hypothetical protein
MFWGRYKLDETTGNLARNGEAWSDADAFFSDMGEGVVNALYYTSISDYTLLINMADNASYESNYTADPIGKVVKDSSTDDLDVIKMLSGSPEYKVTRPWWLSDYLPEVPLWSSYTEEEHTARTKPSASDYVSIKSVSIADVTGTDPSHGLRFIEDQPHDSYEDYDDDDNVNFDDDVDEDGILNADDSDYDADSWNPLAAEIDPNSSIKKYFDITLSPEGLLHIALKPDVALEDLGGNTFSYFFRAYVNDGVNDGLTGTPYFRATFFIVFSECFPLYMGDTVSETGESAIYTDSNSVSTTWYWYDSTSTGGISCRTTSRRTAGRTRWITAGSTATATTSTPTKASTGTTPPPPIRADRATTRSAGCGSLRELALHVQLQGQGLGRLHPRHGRHRFQRQRLRRERRERSDSNDVDDDATTTRSPATTWSAFSATGSSTPTARTPTSRPRASM